MRIETALAKGSLDRVSRRDPEKIYHQMKRADLATLAPSFHWAQYFTGAGAPAFQPIERVLARFLQGDRTADSEGDRWTIGRPISTGTCCIPRRRCCRRRSSNENFDFYGKTLTGAKEMRPRWKRCVDFTDSQLGEALGKKYVEKTFGAEGKERTLKMVHALEKALGQDIEKLPWMTPATKKQALVKLQGDHQQDRLSGQVARLFERRRSSATTRWATGSAPTSSNSSASWTRSASRWTGWNGT